MRKILMAGWGYPPDIEGGLDIHVAHLFEELRDAGIEVDLVLPEEYAPDRPDVIGVDAGEGDMLSRASKMSREVVELAEDYDVVHTHDWFGAESGLKAKKYSGTRWVSTFHSLSSGRSRTPSPRIEEMERAMAERADSTIAVSRKLADELEEEFGIEPHVIHNGFSRKKVSGIDIRQELGIDGRIFLFVGRHAEQKGLEHLIYGFSKYLKDNEATLVVGGDGHMRDALEEFVELLGIQENVFFTGFIPEDELGDFYSSADVFVSPSINEPFGLTVTEAVEAGTTVVATESGAEEVLPDELVIKIEPDSDSIASGLEKAVERDESRSFESRSWRQMAEDTLEVYEELS